MDAPDQAPKGFDIERPVPSVLGERWMVRGNDASADAPAWEVEYGAGYEAAFRAADAMMARYAGRVGARVEIHIEKACGHLHLRSLSVLDHHGLWEPFLSPFAVGMEPALQRLLAARMPTPVNRLRGFPSKGGDA